MNSVGVLQRRRGWRGPGAEARERGKDAARIDRVFEPPTQLPQNLPRAGSIAPVCLAPIQLSLNGSDFVMC
jgi:hypothetical protein